MTEYRRVDSFERERVDAVAVGRDAVAVVADRNVAIVTGADRTTFEHDAAVRDVALGDRVVLLTDRQVVAYSRDGDRLWEQSRPEAYAVAARPADGAVGLLAGETVRVVDEDAGRERATIERERPGRSSDDAFVAAGDGFVVATWSFLTGVSVEGAVSFDRNFDTVIRSVGRCGDVLVVSFQNDRLVGVDAATGEVRWRTELPVSHVSPGGADRAFVTARDGVRSISPEGSIEAASGIDDGTVYAATDGAVICSIRSGTVSTHVPVQDRLDVEVATDTVGVGGSLEVVATNETESSRRTTLEASLDGGTLSPAERAVDLEPGSSEVVDFPVASVAAEGGADVEIRDGDAVLARSSVAIQDAADTTLGVEASLRPTEIVDGVVTLEVTVENVGDVELDEIAIFETDDGVTDVPPGEIWVTTVSRPFDPGRTATVGLEAVRGTRRSEFAPTCTLPAAPTIGLTEDGDALRARIEVDEGVTVADQLVVEVPGFGRVRTEVEIEDDLLLIVPSFEDGTARIRLADVDVSARSRVSGRSPLSGPSQSRAARSGTGNRGDDRVASDAESVADAGSSGRGDESVGETDAASPDQAAGFDRSPASGRADKSGASGRTDKSEASAESDRAAGFDGAPSSDRAAPSDRSTAPSGLAPTDESTADAPDLTVERTVEGEPTPLGRVVRERVTLRSADGAEDVVVRAAGDSLDVGTVGAESSVTLERRAAVLADGASLSPIEVSAGGSTVERLSSEDVEIADDAVHVQLAVDPDDGAVRGEVHNGTAEPIRLRGLRVGEFDLTPAPEASIETGDRTGVEGRIRRSPGADLDAVDVTLEVERQSGETETVEGVAAVQSLEAGSADEAPISASIGQSTEVAGDYGTVVVVVENETERTLDDVSVTAEGEAINRMLYSGAHRDSLPPGGRIEHYIDLKAGDADVTVDVDVTYEAEGAEYALQYRATGPAVEEERDWTDNHRDAWSIDRRSESGAVSIELPSLLPTGFERG